mmetsp:Transcript_43868/g.108001  ORF Transcript_43868/g.108001 Transcript_43868/m.108001 type:complete len:269 (+) Transcript_43868:455-1261(+)
MAHWVLSNHFNSRNARVNCKGIAAVVHDGREVIRLRGAVTVCLAKVVRLITRNIVKVDLDVIITVHPGLFVCNSEDVQQLMHCDAVRGTTKCLQVHKSDPDVHHTHVGIAALRCGLHENCRVLFASLLLTWVIALSTFPLHLLPFQARDPLANTLDSRGESDFGTLTEIFRIAERHSSWPRLPCRRVVPIAAGDGFKKVHLRFILGNHVTLHGTICLFQFLASHSIQHVAGPFYIEALGVFYRQCFAELDAHIFQHAVLVFGHCGLLP